MHLNILHKKIIQDTKINSILIRFFRTGKFLTFVSKDPAAYLTNISRLFANRIRYSAYISGIWPVTGPVLPVNGIFLLKLDCLVYPGRLRINAFMGYESKRQSDYVIFLAWAGLPQLVPEPGEEVWGRADQPVPEPGEEVGGAADQLDGVQRVADHLSHRPGQQQQQKAFT